MHWWTALVASTYPMARYLVLFEFRQQKDKSKSKSNLKCTSVENKKQTAECEHVFMCVRPWRAFPSRASSSGLSSAFSFSMWKSSWFCVALFISVCFKRPSITLIWDSFCAACKPWEQLLLDITNNINLYYNSNLLSRWWNPCGKSPGQHYWIFSCAQKRVLLRM